MKTYDVFRTVPGMYLSFNIIVIITSAYNFGVNSDYSSLGDGRKEHQLLYFSAHILILCTVTILVYSLWNINFVVFWNHLWKIYNRMWRAAQQSHQQSF